MARSNGDEETLGSIPGTAGPWRLGRGVSSADVARLLCLGTLTLSIGWVGGWVGGCKAGTQRPQRPATMVASASGGLANYSMSSFNDDLKLYNTEVTNALADSNGTMDPARLGGARLRRDMIINRIRADIRDYSGLFEDELRVNLAQFDTSSDIVTLGLTAATTIVGGAGSKTVLSAINAAVQGASLSIDKNYFREQTSEAIIAALRTNRLRQDTVILSKMTDLSVDKYPLEEAWNDLIDLYYAGTLASGFQSLAEQAAVKAEAAKATKMKLEEARSEKLREALNSPPPATLLNAVPRLLAATGKLSDAHALEVARKLAITAETGEAARSAINNDRSLNLNSEQRINEHAAAFDAVVGREKW